MTLAKHSPVVVYLLFCLLCMLPTRRLYAGFTARPSIDMEEVAVGIVVKIATGLALIVLVAKAFEWAVAETARAIVEAFRSVITAMRAIHRATRKIVRTEGDQEFDLEQPP